MRRSIGLIMVMLFVVAGAVAIWAASNMPTCPTACPHQPPCPTACPAPEACPPPAPVACPPPVPACPPPAPVVCPPAQICPPAETKQVIGCERDRCKKTCEAFIKHYDRTYGKMACHEGDPMCWQACWTRFRGGGSVAMAPSMGMGAGTMGGGAVSTYMDATAQGSAGSMGTMGTGQNGYSAQGSMGAQGTMGGGMAPGMGAGGMAPGMMQGMPMAAGGMDEMRAFWMQRRPTLMRRNQCAQACWRIHHSGSNVAAVKGWRSAPRPYPWPQETAAMPMAPTMAPTVAAIQ